MGTKGVHLGNNLTEDDVKEVPKEIYFDSRNATFLHTLVRQSELAGCVCFQRWLSVQRAHLKSHLMAI